MKTKNIKLNFDFLNKDNLRLGCLLINDQVDICGLEPNKIEKKINKKKPVVHPFHKIISIFPSFYKICENISYEDNEEKEKIFEKMWCSLVQLNILENNSSSSENSIIPIHMAAQNKNIYDFFLENFNIRIPNIISPIKNKILLKNILEKMYVSHTNANGKKNIFHLSEITKNLNIDSPFQNSDLDIINYSSNLNLYTSEILKFKLKYVFCYKSYSVDYNYFIGINENIDKNSTTIESYFSYIRSILNDFIQRKSFIEKNNKNTIYNEIEKSDYLIEYFYNKNTSLESMFNYKMEIDEENDEIIQNIRNMIYSYNKLMRNAIYIVFMCEFCKYAMKFLYESNQKIDLNLYEINSKMEMIPVSIEKLYEETFNPLANYLKNIFFLDRQILSFPKNITE